MAGYPAGMDELGMSAKERIRLDALGRVKPKEVTLAGAAGLMGLSVRRARRMRKRLSRDGDGGLWYQRREKHRGRLERRSCFGPMMPMDGSHHDRFEGRAGRCVSWRSLWLQTGKEHESMHRPGKRVLVTQKADAKLLVEDKSLRLIVTTLSRRPEAARRPEPVANNGPREPPVNHLAAR